MSEDYVFSKKEDLSFINFISQEQYPRTANLGRNCVPTNSFQIGLSVSLLTFAVLPGHLSLGISVHPFLWIALLLGSFSFLLLVSFGVMQVSRKA